MIYSSPLDLEVDHLGHDEPADAHPDQPAEAGDDERWSIKNLPM